MRNIFKTLSILFFGSIFFLSCEIGLGSSVDTEAPNLEIQNPSPDAIIRGAFKIGGTWSDDGTIETVTVKLSRTDGKGSEIEYQANFAESNDDSPNTWNCIINPQDSANTVLDGNYIAQVDITDGGKHTTTKTVQFAIDNTAPVIVLQRPSTKIDALQVDSYGQKFTLEGQAADDNNVSLIEVQIYADKECTTLLHTVPLSNVPNSINLDVAEFKENVETDYSKIYGSTQKSGQKNFYCKVVAYDGAVYYPYDRTQTPEDLKGNKTSIYYLYEDIATAVLGEVKITDVYHILSGVYGLEKESSRSAETNSLIAKVKSALEKNVVNTGSFSLNPANNPTFSVSGKEPLQKDENGNVNFASGNYDITNGSQVIMEVTPGLDNIPLDGNSLKVYCIECDAKGTAKSGASKIYPATEMKKSGTTYKYTVSVKKQDGLVIGRNYLFGVDGYDEKKNNVVCSDNLGYGFHFSTSGAAPGLTILEPEAGSVTLANGKKLKISGTTTVEAGTPVITITDNKVNKTTLTFQESEATEDENKQLIYTFSTEIDFTGGSAYHELEIVSDLEGIKTTRTKSVSYDSEKPVIAINSVNPIVEKTEPNGQSKKCLNGEVQISFSLTDDFSFIDTTTNKPYFELWQNNEKKYTATFTSTNSAVTETVTVDTNKLRDNTPLEIKVFTWDRAGNKAEYSDKQYQIDQSTDKPQITPKNNINFNLKSEEDIKKAGNNENRISMGGTVSFTVTDDDGIDYIAVYSQTKDAQGKITETLYNRYPKEGSSKETQTPYSFILPSKSGYYLYRLEVKDIINTKTENNKQEYQFMIKATSPAPTIELISEEDSSTNYDNNADGYIKAGGAFVNTITVESVESPFTLWEKIDAGEYKKVENTKLENSEGKNYFKRKVSPEGTSTYYYKVEDSNEQYSSERSVKCKVDNDASTITPKSYPQTKQDTRVSQYTISGTAVDTDSGVNKVYIAFANEDKKYSDWKEVGGTENWYYTLKYAEDDNFKEYFSQEKHGIKYIKFKVVDKVGWEYETQAIQFFYDTADPTAEITAYKTEAADYTILTSAGVKTGKAFSLKGKATDDWGIETATLTQTFKPKQNESAEQQTEKSLTLALELGTGGSWEVGNLPRSYEQGKENEAALITGDYEYKLVVKDKAGNETQTILNVEVDTTAPVITVGDPTGLNGERFINTKNLTITGTIVESNLSTAEAKLMKKDGSYFATGQISPDNDGSFSWKVYEVADGEYTVEVYAIDSFGNNTTEKGSSFTVDTIAPVSTLTATGNQVYDNTGKAVTELTSGSTYYVKGNYTLSGTVTETNFKSAKLGEKTLTASSGTWSKEITPSDETIKTQAITLEDKAGNKTVYTVYVAKDTSTPLLTVTSPTEGVNAASITVTGQVSDLGIGVESVSYELYKDGVETPVTTQTLTNKAGQFNFTSVDLTGEGKGEGKYKIKVTAQDKLENKTTATVVNFMYDNTPPTLSDPKITPPPIRNDYNVGSGEKYTVYAKDSFEIEVNATDLVSGVNTVTAESGNTKVTLTKDEQGNGTGKYTGTITAVLDKDNSTTITIKATDFCNQTRTVSITNIMVDKVAPDLTVTSAVPQITNKAFTVTGTVSDEIKIGDTPVIVKESSGKTYAVNITDETGENAGKKVWSFTVNPSQSGGDNSAADGNHTFTIEATDKAGNKASQSIEVVTDVTKPTVSISKTPDVNATEGTVFVFEGTAEDGSGSGVSEIWMKFEGTEGEISVPVSSTWLKSITFSDYEYFNTSGEKKVLVRAKDRAGNESLWTEKSFDYDKGKPEAEITAYKTEEAAGYTTLTSAGVKAGKAFSLKGKATDDWEVTSVRITQKQGERTVVVYKNNKGGDWEVAGLPRSFDNAEETNVESGEYEYVLEVTDKAGKKTQVTMKAGIDTNAPEVTVEDPEGITQYRFINTKNLTIKGNVQDANLSVAKACLKKENESSENYEAVSVGSDGSFSWKVYDVEEGKYQIKVYAEDTYGNNTTVTGNYFTVDTTAPVSTLRADSDKVYDRDGTAQTALSNGSSYYVKDDTFELSGTVTEENLKSMTLDGSSVTVTNNQWNAQIAPSGETAETHTIVLEDKAGNKTVYTVYVTKDKSAPLLTVTSPTEGVNAASIKVRGQVSDLGIGVKSVTCSVYKANGTSETQIGTTQKLSGVAGQFEFNEVTLDSEGKYKVKISAQDKLGNKTEETVIETVNDKTGPSIQTPEIGEAKIADYTKDGKTYRVYAKDTFNLTVNVSDALSKVSAVTAESGSVSTSLSQVSDRSYKGTVTVSSQEGGIASIKIKATDSCGNTSESVTDDIMVDKEAPELTVTSTVPQVTKESFTVSGTVSDEIKIGDTPVIVKESSGKKYTVTVTDGTGENAGKKVWSFTVNPSQSGGDNSAADGNHAFTIEATDKAGNKASCSISVLIDTTAPEVKISKTPSTEDSEGTVYVFEGTANDGSGSGVSEIWMKFEGTEGEISVPVSSTWLKSITFSDYEYFNTSGEKKVSVRAKDRAGNESLWTEKSFKYDKGKPEAEITAYKTEEAAGYTTLTSAGVKAGKAFSLKGKATDDWEVTSVKITQKQGESTVVVYEDNKGGDWEVERLPRSFDNAEVTNVVSGEYEYVLEVTDKAGKKTQVTMKAGIDTNAPEVTVEDPEGITQYSFINTKNLTIKGNVQDANLSVAKACLKKENESSENYEAVSVGSDGSFSWKVYDVEEGKYQIKVYAEDSYGNYKTVTGDYFTVDTTAPVSTLRADSDKVYDRDGTAQTALSNGSSYYVKDDTFELRGEVTEENLKSMTLDGNSVTVTNNQWNAQITPSGETAETHTIVLEDKAGNKTVYTVYVAKDTLAPDLTVTSPTKGVNAASIKVRGQVSDLGIGVKSVTCSVYKTDGTSETQVGNTQTLSGVAGQFEFNEVTLNSEGKYKVKISAQDKLGNKTEETVIETVNDKTGPSIQTPGIGEEKIADYTKEGKTYRVYAKDTFYLTVKVSDALSDVSAVTAESGNTKVTLTEEKDEQGNGTGKYEGSITAQLDDKNTTTITITATDKFNNKNTESITNIMVDKVAPDLTVTSAVPQVTKESFTVSGTVSDEIKIGDTPVIVKESSGKKYTVTVTDGTGENAGKKVWSFTVNPSQSGGDNSAADGNHTFTIEATDKAGNKASQSIEVVTDVTKPTVSIGKIPDKYATEGTGFVFEGTANDGSGSGVSEIWMKFGENGTVFKASGTSSWLKSITFSEYSNVFNTSGEKKVFVMAKDRAGNESDWISQDFIYDTKKPDAKISEYKIGEAGTYTTLTSAGVKTGKAFSLKGIATDDWEVTSVKLTQKQGENKVVVYENNKGGDWEVERLPRSFDNKEVTNVESGEYEYVLEVTDKAGKKTQVTMKAGIDTNAPEVTVEDPEGITQYKFINTKNLTIKGNVKDANLSVAKACLKKENESSENYEAVSVGSDGSFSWKVYDVEEGKYQIKVYAEDSYGNNTTVTGNYFTVDTTAPVSTLTADSDKVYDRDGTAQTALSNGSSYYVKDDTFELRGTVTEENLKSMTLDGSSVTVTNNQWNAQITPSGETAETHTIVLEDKAGNKTVYTVYVSKDKSAPLLTVTSPTEGVNAASIKVRGQVSDLGIGVKSVTCSVYKTDGTSETQVGTTQTLSGVAGQFEFNEVTLNSEGKYKVKISAQDKLGNKTEETVIETVNDKTGPSIQTPGIGEAKIADYTKEGKTYRVYAKDTFYLTVKVSDALSKVSAVTAESGSVSTSLNQTAAGTYTGTVTVSLQEGGTASIKIKATDSCGNTSESVTDDIMVDKVAPTISNLTYPTTPQKNKFTISVSASDVIALADAEDNPVKIKYKKNESDETLPMTLNNGVYEIELTPGTGTDSDSVHYIPDGNHTFTIEATDKAGNKASQSIEVVTDVTAPTWVTTPKISSKSAYTQETREYYKSNLININVKATDETSGVKEIVYKLDSRPDTSTGNANITLDNLSEGMHTVSIKAVDEAGNGSNDTILIFYIDTRSPLKPELMSIDSESGKALADYINESKSKLVNGQSDVTFVLSVSDASSKASESDTEYMSGIESVKVLRIASDNVNIPGQKGADGQYTITIPKGNLVTGSVTVRITDNVGNTYEGTVFNLQLDNTDPFLKISSPANGATVNKTITISGATTDNNAVAQTVVTVKKGETEVRKETFTAENSNELSWSLDLDTFVQNITNTEKTENLTITVTATDKAGNTKSETRTITVDQDTDRPVISFNNVTLGNAMNSSDLKYYIWLKNTTKLYGTVEDDDGITSMQISNNGTNWHYVTLTKTSWSFDVKNFFGDETANKEAAANGAHTIYFKVTDKEGEEFNSATLSSLDSVYLVDGVNKYGEIGTGSAKPDSVLYVKVDTLPPEVILIGARIGTTGDFSTTYSNMTLGGAQDTMEFKLTAKDSNGIESVSGTAEFEFDGASVTLSSSEVKAYKAGDKKTTVGASDVEYYIVSFTVDLAGAQSGLNGKDGRISLKFTGEDKAGNSSAQTATINYDYKKPEVTITSPKDSNWVSGIVTAYGTIDSAATMYYALSPSDTITPAEPDAVSSGGNITGQTAESGTGNSHEVNTWSGINPEGLDEVTGSGITVTPKYSQIKGNGVQWFVYFDNQPSTELATHDVEFKNYLINSGITTKDAIDKKNFTTIVKLYLWVKSIDLAGNITVEKFPILVDPQGDAPQVTISYPAKDGETLGGAVTLLGTASDTIGANIGIKNVWVQIMSGTKESAATPSVDDVNLWIKNGYTVCTDIENSTPVNSAIDSSPENYYIQANVSGSSWSLKINGNDEFSPSEGSTNNIVYRVYAQDKDNKLSKYQTQYSIFDADNPVLSDLYLRQYYNNSEGTGTITASRPYEDDMWIKGDWWLCGTVKDTQGIASLKVGEETITVSGELDKKEEFKYKISTTGSDAGNKTISIVAEDKASPSHMTKKTCSINYDNKDPDSFEPVIANNIIQNRNGFFTFSAEVKEDAVSGAAQSGFKYLAFYFTRGDKVYDIMRSKTDEKSAIDKSNSASFPTENGLIWKKLTVTRSSDSLAIITLSDADENANIHTGGLCKIGGSIYMIKNMIKNENGTTIELDGSPEMPASGNSQDALFAIANVVNNNIESGNGTKSTSLDYYGYFTSISNDDGDHMVESVLKTGTTWKWEANINSRNIPDGEVTLHYVAFDAAGNYSAQSIEKLQIANNAPRLASVKVWTDYNGNGKEDDNEHATKYYSKKTVVIGGKSQTKSQDLTSELLLSGNDLDEANGGSAFMTIKAETKLIPELVGGNGDLYYTYKIKKNKLDSWPTNSTKSNGSFATGNDDGIDDEAGNGGYYVVDDEKTAYISGTIYDGKTENKNPIVITTDILGNLENNENNSDPTWFEYVIYDSTDGCKDWSDSNYTSGRLSAKFKVALNVQYNDEVKPQVSVRPFYWNSKTDNSVCWDSTSDSALSALGHIELEGDLTPTITNALGNDPKVSGKIKIEGYAFDNIKLKYLYVQFAGHKDITSKKLAATYTTSGNTTSWVKSSETGIGDTWDFEATDIFNNSEGHLVYWTLTVDTQEVDTQAVDTAQVQVARLDQKVTVIAKDERGKEGTITGGLESASSGNKGQSKMLWKDVKTSAGALTMFYTNEACNTLVNADTSDDTPVYLKEKWDYQMDIVPYITGVNTSLSTLDRKTPSKFDRTALGHYPVRIVTKAQNGSVVNQAETVTFTGFNLGSNTSLDVSKLTTQDDLTTGGKSYVPTVNGIPVLNNMNNNDAKGSYSGTISDDSSYDDKVQYAYNRQPNNANNNRLTDDIIFDVWQFNSAAAVPISGKIEQPVMKIRPTDGKIGFAFVNGPLYFSMGGSASNEDYSYQYWMASYDFFTSVGFTYDDAGNSWGVAAGGDINETHADKFQLMSSKWGRSNRTKDGSYSNTNSMRLESIGMKGTKSNQNDTTNYYDKQRIRSPSLASSVHDGKTNLYLAYYDAMNDELRFKAGRNYKDLNADGFVCKILYADNAGQGGWSGVWIDKPTTPIQDGDYVIICDENGNPVEASNGSKEVYTLNGYYDDSSGKIAFHVKKGNVVQRPFPKGFGDNEYELSEDGALSYPKNPVYAKIVRELGDFVDFDKEKSPYEYRNSTVNIVAGNGVTGYGAGEYVSLGVVPGTTAANDVVVITWYDTNARTLYYSYNTTPLTNRSGTYNAADGTTGWFTPVPVFARKDYDNAGEYCKIAVDKNGGIHIAAYDPVNLDLVYAYAPSYESSFTTCVVDSNGVVGSNLTLDVALENGNAIPFIGYYATSCIKPKYARLVGNLSNGSFDGSINDEVTGKWEISVVPTSSIIEMQSNQHNDINIGVWKTDGGVITESNNLESSTNNTSNGYNSTSNGQIFGNGTKNPVLGYAIKYGSSGDTIETAQMK